MKNKMLVAVVLCLAVVALVRSFGKPVMAQMRAALVQSVDEPGRNPFAFHASVPNRNFASFSVPVGQRYVVETYTGLCFDSAPGYLTDLTLQGATNGAPVRLSTQPHLEQENGITGGRAQSIYIGTASQTLYADPGSSLSIFANDSTAGGGLAGCEFWITGHIINNP